MAVILKTAEILFLFGALGLPLNLLLLPQLDRSSPRRTLSGRILLAPGTGLAAFALYTVFFFAAGAPVAGAVVFSPLLLALAWGACYFFRPAQKRLPLLRDTRPRSWLFASAGLAVVLGFHVWPFLQNPALVFWHHAGTDGYMYMRAAEHAYSPGTGVIPFVGPYDAASGFVAETVKSFQFGLLADKPGAMSTLAGVAGLLGIIPQAAFSPLVIAAMAIFYLALLGFAHLRLGLPAWGAGIFALLGTLCPAAWMLSTHTFFGNTLALPLFVMLLLLPRAHLRRGTVVSIGLCLVALFVIFPDGMPALVGMLAVATPYWLWSAWRRGRLGRFLQSIAVLLVVAVVLGFPLGRPVFGTMKDRLMGVASGLTTPSAIPPAGPTPVPVKSSAAPDWIWGALNVNTIPPQPLQPDERRHLVYFSALLLVFLGASAWRREAGQLAWYVTGFLLILLLGLAGLFHSDYELFRALAVFAYLPLAAICTLPWLLVPQTGSFRQLAARLAVIGALTPLLFHFFQVDRRHFTYAYGNHFSDAQYTIRDLQDRTNLARVAEHIPLVLGTEVPSHFGVFNSMELFSNLRVGVPTAFHKFVFFSSQPGEAAYRAPAVLRNLHYIDISEPRPDQLPLYRGENFEVVPNDLVPFLDEDTLPAANTYPADSIRLPQSVARLFSTRTTIAFYCQQPRTVALVLQVSGLATGSGVSFAFDGGPRQSAAPQPPDGAVILVSALLATGLHHVALEAPDQPGRITALWLREADASGRPLNYDGTRRVRPGESVHFQHLNPQPVRFYSQYGTNLWGDFLTAHATTRLYFQPPAGPHHLRTSLRLDPAAYENLPPGQATDGVTFEVALIRANGSRTMLLSRRVDPVHVPADRGVLPIDLRFTLPEQTQLELVVGPGPDHNGARDWAGLGPLTID